MSSMYCWSLFGGRYIAAIMIGLLLLMCILWQSFLVVLVS